MKHRIVLLALLLGYLGLQGGQLVLWNSAGTEPVQTFPYRAESFSPADQEKLRQGIPFSSRQELHSILEDYLS